jgi:oligoribonuclease NrnB/cAMP/cGMP phosphodiesterase (DHH superfamily)
MLVITHANCNDGFTAAWIANRYYTQVKGIHPEFIECHYQDPSLEKLNVRDRRVVVFDFSFYRDLMIRLEREAYSFHVWDHHETAQKECEGLPFVTFDPSKSGAMLAWEHFYPGVTVPNLVNYVQDRDLWTWQLPNSRAINAYLMSWQRNFQTWDSLNTMIETRFGEVVEAGQTIVRITEGAVGKAFAFASTAVIGGVRVPFVNATSLISETLEAMAKGKPFAVSFFMEKTGAFVFSLRSDKDGMNVGKIAREYYGGGGHAHAAGFRLRDISEILSTLEA